MEYDDEVAHRAVQTLYQRGRCEDDSPQLFDLASDPDEMQYLSNGPAYGNKMVHFTTLIMQGGI